MKKSPFLTLDSARVEIARLAAALAKSSAADPVQPLQVQPPLNLAEANAIIVNLQVQVAQLKARIAELEAQLAEAKKAPAKPKTNPNDPNATADPDDKDTFQKASSMTEESLAAAIYVEKDFRKQNAMVRTLAAMQTARAIAQVKAKKVRRS